MSLISIYFFKETFSNVYSFDFQSNMSTSMDTESVRAAYDDVRSDSSDTQWLVFSFI